jgi:DNA-binding transcriptional LysR family regulator
MALQANWDDLRLLLAVSRRGSFLQAGQLLGVAASTVSRRLSQLEAALGEPLVERGVEGCWLTSRGQSLVDVAVLPRILAEGLSEVFQEIQLPPMEVYLVTRPQALKQAHIHAFFTQLEQVLRATLQDTPTG